MNIDSIRTDVDYAIAQLRVYRDIGRAIQALERVQHELMGETLDLPPLADPATCDHNYCGGYCDLCGSIKPD